MKALGIDARDTMRIFCEDRDLNISPAYLRPGFAFGGSCLPTELRAVAELAKSQNLQLTMLTSILTSNDSHIDRTSVESGKSVSVRVDLGGRRILHKKQ